MDALDSILNRLEDCVRSGRYESLETDGLEIKPVPATGHAWDSIHHSVCAFLNTRGGVVILGVKEEKKPDRHFDFTGYTENYGGNLSRLRTDVFQDGKGHAVDVGDCLRLEVRPFATGQVALLRVAALPEDRKFCYCADKAYERVVDRDEAISATRIGEQEERKREMETERELRPVAGVTLADLSLQRINELIMLINKGQSTPIETLKGTLIDAVPFLEKKRFMLKDGAITTLGVLICASQPEEHLLFRCHLDAFVDVPNSIAQDKKSFRDNILQLMELGHGWTLRNILTGIAPDGGGTMAVEYPDALIRESINNALAHRDYSINRPVQITIKPRISLSIRNPGQLPAELILDAPDESVPVRRIFPNPKARNARLASILMLHDKWEGRGKGMSDLVNYALANQIDVPHYLFHSADELTLRIPAGKVLDEGMEAWLDLFSGFIAKKGGSRTLTREQNLVLAYLIKSERLNRDGMYTLALTQGNNHFGAIKFLKEWGLVSPHKAGDRFREVLVVCRELAAEDEDRELNGLFGHDYTGLDPMGRGTLSLISLAEKYSVEGGLNAKQISRLLGVRLPEERMRRGADEFYRAIRYRVERMAPDKKLLLESPSPETWVSNPERMLSLRGTGNRPLFRLNREYRRTML